MKVKPSPLPPSAPADRTEILLDLLDQLRGVDPEFPLHYSICLVEIARDEGLSLTQLAERTHLTLSTVSRIAGALSQFRQNGHPYGLIEMRVAANERRRKELYLTPKGRAVIKNMESVLETHLHQARS